MSNEDSEPAVAVPRLDGDTVPSWLLNALPHPLFVIGADGRFLTANYAAEEFFQVGGALLRRQSVSDLLPFASPLATLIEQARTTRVSMSEYGVELDGPRFGNRVLDAQAVPIPELPEAVLVILQERTIAMKMSQQLTHRGAVRAVTGMAAMLAHEIKNPLSGIRGSAQLLEQSASDEDKEFTRLICTEADRIVKLVDRMEVFSNPGPPERGPVNIHEVLGHVRRLAQTGFANSVRFVEDYDPSLPPVLGDRDQLIQVFLNLVKNAAEAVDPETGEIVISTAYRPGVRLSVLGHSARVNLPLEVAIRDNGRGIAEDVRAHLFDPFVTTKRNGSGLGLALVAKVIGDHGGVVECDSEPGRTVFRVRLPMVEEESGAAE